MFNVALDDIGVMGWITNGLVIVVTAALLAAFARKRVRSSTLWRATVTPLASIIGSGFLVVAPLLGFTAGRWAVVAMAGIVALAFAVGSAVRYNIAHVEEITEGEEKGDGRDRTLRWLGRVGKIVLAVAYVIAVTFYLELLGAFLLRMFGVQDTNLQKLIATALIVFIGAVGHFRGLQFLESLEKYAVETKLSIIGGLLVGLALYNGELLLTGAWELPRLSTTWNFRTVRQLLGAFLIVQGFETSRYLRGVYTPEHRIRTMRYAQLGATGIYLAFVGLSTVLLGVFHSVSETGIISLSERVAFTLPILLIIGAVGSQFSAAVADTIGSGGLVGEVTRGKVKPHLTYAAVAALALLLVWTSDIFGVIAYASRAFALYYAVQAAMASLHAIDPESGSRKAGRATFFAVMALLMLITTVFGIPAESSGAGG
ncbi:MAG: hypothetical protein PVF68_05900 [Acidobacteriota bacterium]